MCGRDTGHRKRAGEAARESGAVETERRDHELDRGQDMETKPKEAWGLVRTLETQDWLERNVPSAADWFLLWRVDDMAKHHAVRMAQSLPQHRRHHLIHAHVDIERQSSLGLIGELMAAESRAKLALEALGVSPEIVERIELKRARISELVAELQIDPTVATETKP